MTIDVCSSALLRSFAPVPACVLLPTDSICATLYHLTPPQLAAAHLSHECVVSRAVSRLDMCLHQPVQSPLDGAQGHIQLATGLIHLPELKHTENEVGGTPGQRMGALQVVCNTQETAAVHNHMIVSSGRNIVRTSAAALGQHNHMMHCTLAAFYMLI
jgi:hypothetical protein